MKTKLVLAVLLLTIFTVSCSTTGTYMPFKYGEIVIGTVQETLHVQTSYFSPQNKDAINTEVYGKMIETARQKDIIFFPAKQRRDKHGSLWQNA